MLRTLVEKPFLEGLYDKLMLEVKITRKSGNKRRAGII